MKLEDAILAD